MKGSLNILLSSCVVFSLAGCSAFPPYKEDRSAPQPREYHTQKSSNNQLSPEEMHARAKAQVEPTKMVQHNAYVKNERQARAEIEAHSRLASMERDLDIVKNDFKGIKDTVRRADIVPAAASIAPASGGDVAVKGVRTGAHPGKTRLVLDMDGPAEFQYEIDSVQNLLIIRLSATEWDAPRERVFRGERILKAYAAKPANNGGTVVALKLHGPSKVLRSAKLGKNTAGHHRIFFDVAPL